MKSFNVLDRNQDVHRDYLLEASAGTGKTFSIENIIVRLLVEDSMDKAPCTLDQILVVTFTRAATRDLKARIRSNIERSLAFFNRALNDPNHATLFSGAPDYLLGYLEMGDEVLTKGKKVLEHALFCYDQSQIFTIHGFCSRMLSNYLFEGDIIADTAHHEGAFTQSQLIEVIRDYFRTELRAESFSTQQLKIISQEYDHSTEKMELAILRVISSGLEIADLPDFQMEFLEFSRIMQQLKQEQAISADNLLADFVLQAPTYEKLCDRSRAIKSDVLDKVSAFAQLFDQDSWTPKDFELLLNDGLFIVEALDPTKRLLKSKPLDESLLNYPNLISRLKNDLYPLIESARSPLQIISRIGRGCQRLLKRYLDEEERLGFDDLLKAMVNKLETPSFAEKIRSQYRAAIIDEFQDTDPIQWKIFKTLFMNAPVINNLDPWGHLYLVGDPKQSIYAFRQADIYTYLSAAQMIGVDHQASLDTNYRSQASLVGALNWLFAKESAPGLISLPRTQSILDYQPVKAGANLIETTFADSFGSVHFCIAEDSSSSLVRAQSLPLEKFESEYLFPFFAEEIQRLHDQDKLTFRQFAILVSDRFQAQRIADYLKDYHIPTVAQRNKSLSDSPALSALQDLLKVILHPRNENFLKTALGSKLFGWTHSEIEELIVDSAILERVLLKIYPLRKILFADGFSKFFPAFLASRWIENSSMTVLERLLSEEEGADFYQDIQQLAELLYDLQAEQYVSSEGLLQFLDELPLLEVDGDERLKKRSDPTRDAVQILTLHSSKGLEFDIVFTLGLVKRPHVPSQLIPVTTGNQMTLTPILDHQSIAYKSHCQEIDAEKIRQLYVGMTRAKYRLYIPVISFSSSKPIAEGSASPMDLFLARLGQPEASLEELYERINGYDGKPLIRFLESLPCELKITHSFMKKFIAVTKSDQQDMPPLLVIPPELKVLGNKEWIYSFTTLAKESFQNHGSEAAEGISRRVPIAYTIETKTAHTLPSNIEVGILFHRLFECLSFDSISQTTVLKEVVEMIRPYLQGMACQEWEEVMAQIVLNTLTAPLETSENAFSLCNISDNQRYCEMEFIYPCNQEMKIEELESSTGFLKGVIDLIFSHKGKYYLLDWKSNWLGDRVEDYHSKNLENAMRTNHYFLQASIYTLALEKYLKVVDQRPFEEIFGGVYYLFLRGIDPKNPKNPGIYHFHPSTS